VECLDQVNGGGWGCIYSLQPLPSRCSFSADRGRSAPLVWTVRPYTSTTEITTVSSNGPWSGRSAPWSGRSAPAHQQLKSQRSAVTTIVHLMCHQMSDKEVADGPVMHLGRAARTLKIHFTEPVTFGFF
jgi:hypothetical protein